MTLVNPAQPAAATTGGQYRKPIITAAIELTVTSGWAAVTMGKLAQIVGVSRQTVYNELGSKTALAEAMVADQLERFLSIVDAAFERHPDDLVEAIYDAVRSVLRFAHDNTLLRTIVSATHGAESELLPLLTIRADALLTQTKTALTRRVETYRPPLTDNELAAIVDIVVRSVLSHIMQPSDSPERTADSIAWLAAQTLDTTSPPSLRHRAGTQR